MDRWFGTKGIWFFSLMPVALLGFLLFTRLYDAGEWEPFSAVNDEVKSLLASDWAGSADKGQSLNSGGEGGSQAPNPSAAPDATGKPAGMTSDSDSQAAAVEDSNGTSAAQAPNAGSPPPNGVNPGSTHQPSAVSADSSLIDINTASVTELTALPGIGPSKANAIVTYRQQNQGFKSINDLMEVKGIGQKTFEKLKDLITVSPYPAASD